MIIAYYFRFHVNKLIIFRNYPMRKILLHADFCSGREMRYVHQNERTCRTGKLILSMNLRWLRSYPRYKLNFEKIQ